VAIDAGSQVEVDMENLAWLDCGRASPRDFNSLTIQVPPVERIVMHGITEHGFEAADQLCIGQTGEAQDEQRGIMVIALPQRMRPQRSVLDSAPMICDKQDCQENMLLGMP
jgi:hypothetical protein